jgi:hypothetical protein
MVCARTPTATRATFLFATTQDQLADLRFPLGDMTKAKTRDLARRFGLSVADKHDSQDICFVPTGRYTDVIERLKPNAMEPGDIVDLNGRVLGRHQGIINYHHWPAPRSRHRARSAALRRAPRCGDAPRRGRPARGAAHARSCCATSTGSATATLDRRSGDGARTVRQGALDPAGAAGLAANDGWRL